MIGPARPQADSANGRGSQPLRQGLGTLGQHANHARSWGKLQAAIFGEAEALGIPVPLTIIGRADEAIELGVLQRTKFGSPTTEMGHLRRFERVPVTSAVTPKPTIGATGGMGQARGIAISTVHPVYLRSPTSEQTSIALRRWQPAKLTGAKPPLRPKHGWAIRTKLQIDQQTHDLALFNLVITANCGVAMFAVKFDDLAPNGYAVDRATVRQRKTGRLVWFELTNTDVLA